MTFPFSLSLSPSLSSLIFSSSFSAPPSLSFPPTVRPCIGVPPPPPLQMQCIPTSWTGCRAWERHKPPFPTASRCFCFFLLFASESPSYLHPPPRPPPLVQKKTHACATQYASGGEVCVRPFFVSLFPLCLPCRGTNMQGSKGSKGAGGAGGGREHQANRKRAFSLLVFFLGREREREKG